MKRMITILLLSFGLVGCAGNNLAGRYQYPAVAKNPAELNLGPRGTYTWGPMFNQSGAIIETGRWWRVEGNVIVLLPNDDIRPQWFARVDRDSILMPLRRADNLRDVMKETPGQMPPR